MLKRIKKSNKEHSRDQRLLDRPNKRRHTIQCTGRLEIFNMGTYKKEQISVHIFPIRI
jgi:hypothetical protein